MLPRSPRLGPAMHFDQVDRRKFISLLGGAAAWPPAASAQQSGKPPTIGFLSPNTRSAGSQRVATFVQRLHELGWIEDRNIAIEVRWGSGHIERYDEIAVELVRLSSDEKALAAAPMR
jgi:putative tryptophan/tyrosine transport system substrate-binding protein